MAISSKQATFVKSINQCPREIRHSTRLQPQFRIPHRTQSSQPVVRNVSPLQSINPPRKQIPIQFAKPNSNVKETRPISHLALIKGQPPNHLAQNQVKYRGDRVVVHPLKTMESQVKYFHQTPLPVLADFKAPRNSIKEHSSVLK